MRVCVLYSFTIRTAFWVCFLDVKFTSGLSIKKFILDWLNKVTNDDSDFQKISSSKAVEKDEKRIKEVQSKKSELLGNKKATEHKLNNIMNIIESNSAPKSLLK